MIHKERHCNCFFTIRGTVFTVYELFEWKKGQRAQPFSDLEKEIILWFIELKQEEEQQRVKGLAFIKTLLHDKIVDSPTTRYSETFA